MIGMKTKFTNETFHLQSQQLILDSEKKKGFDFFQLIWLNFRMFMKVTRYCCVNFFLYDSHLSLFNTVLLCCAKRFFKFRIILQNLQSTEMTHMNLMLSLSISYTQFIKTIFSYTGYLKKKNGYCLRKLKILSVSVGNN